MARSSTSPRALHGAARRDQRKLDAFIKTAAQTNEIIEVGGISRADKSPRPDVAGCENSCSGLSEPFSCLAALRASGGLVGMRATAWGGYQGVKEKGKGGLHLSFSFQMIGKLSTKAVENSVD